jgi:hypothetical protein
VLEDRPAFSFTLPLGLGASRVELLTPDGRVIWSSPAPTVARRGIVSVPLSEGAPALERGRSFLWRVAWPQGTVTEKFQVASDEQRRAWEEAVRTVEARVDVELRPLVLAHAALRRGLWGEADRWTRALEPADDVRRETIEAVRRRLQLGGTP